MSKADIKEVVRERYAEIARSVGKWGSSCCSGRSSCYDGERGSEAISANLYADHEKSDLPAEAVLASLGCGNPTALAELKEGETVLYLGSGGGIDVLLSARRVGPSGKAFGLDMTDDMLALARENQKKAGAENVEFLKGEIEAIPLPDNSVDVIVSNCVINLSGDKDKALSEAIRVLKPGAVSPSQTSSPAERSRSRFDATCCFGLAASRGRWTRTTIGQNSHRWVSRRSALSQPASTTSRTPASFSPASASTSMRSRPRSRANL
jgi:SAM-dependent methyltransferase